MNKDYLCIAIIGVFVLSLGAALTILKPRLKPRSSNLPIVITGDMIYKVVDDVYIIYDKRNNDRYFLITNQNVSVIPNKKLIK